MGHGKARAPSKLAPAWPVAVDLAVEDIRAANRGAGDRGGAHSGGEGGARGGCAGGRSSRRRRGKQKNEAVCFINDGSG